MKEVRVFMPTVVHESAPLHTFEGIYDLPEAARYLKAAPCGDMAYPVSSATLIRWIRKGLASPELAEIHGAELLIAFEDLVSLRIIAALRATGVRWLEIRQTEQWLRKETGVQRPFATEYLWTGQGQIFAEWTDRLVSASRHGQMALEMLREYLIPIHGLVFSQSSHMATSWEPTKGVLLEPMVQFGAPCIKGTRIPTRTIFGMIEAGDSMDWVMEAYGLSSTEVQVACDWESSLQSR